MGKTAALRYEPYREAKSMPKNELRHLWIGGKVFEFESEDAMFELARENPKIADAIRRRGRYYLEYL